MTPKLIVKINTTGGLQFIWNDALRGLFDAGEGIIRRASHVEPTPEGKWEADLSPVGGPTLGPFNERTTALQEEVKWLETNILGVINAN